MTGTVLVVGGSRGIGHRVAAHYAAKGGPVVVTSRDEGRARAAAEALGANVRGIALDCLGPASVADALGGLDGVDRVVVCAVERDHNSIRSYDLATSQQVVAIKLVGSLAVVSTIAPRMPADGSIVLFGGAAKDHPHDGSTTMTPICAAIAGMVRTLAIELAPMRVNALHPGAIGDSPRWLAHPPSESDALRAQTLTGELPTMADVVASVEFLLENRSVNAVNLTIDGGWLLGTVGG